ncbi:putative methyltransferase PMT2 [Vitis vinifera]|uniref:Methyltransferase n=1 Tax=Vitis vinifera TaxID=29760 RepID=A0A438BUN6_VITVI|nr:putative methyltransferase PMT2 [Vitis vinifera]
MAKKGNAAESKTRSSISIFVVLGLCCFFYILGAWQRSGFGKGDSIAIEVTKQTDCSILSNLNFETHHKDEAGTIGDQFKPCDAQYIDYTPCQDQDRAMTFPREDMNYRERHCPPEGEKLHCLIPAPKGYATPFPWPKSRDYVPFANAPYKNLTVEKAVQNWIQYEGNVFRFPGGGTQFPRGADAYIDELASVIPFENGMVRTALDTGCGVSCSWGAYLFKKNVIAMSFAPRDSHVAQVQFALERGVPAVIGVLGTIKLPYPSGAFDMAHCSRCLIPWGANGKTDLLATLLAATILLIKFYGMYMMEVDRVLRPGGYWVLSGPPSAGILITEHGSALKRISRRNRARLKRLPNFFAGKRTTNANDVWYKQMEACVTPYPKTTEADEVAGGVWKPFPERLNAVPSGYPVDPSLESLMRLSRRMTNCGRSMSKLIKRTNKIIDSGRYRNIMDMNAGLGSFAAALESPKLWVMNVMPTIAEKDTLGVIYERGLIGIYHDCCSAEDILLEMDRILRPEGAVIFRDQIDVLIKVKTTPQQLHSEFKRGNFQCDFIKQCCYL